MAHFTAALIDAPDTTRAYFKRFRDVSDAWKNAKHGLHLAWLVRQFAETKEAKAELSRVSSEAITRLGTDLDLYFKAIKGDRDTGAPLPLAFGDVMAELRIVAGLVEDTKFESSRKHSPDLQEYDDRRTEILGIIADLFRQRMDEPAT